MLIIKAYKNSNGRWKVIEYSDEDSSVYDSLNRKFIDVKYIEEQFPNSINNINEKIKKENNSLKELCLKSGICPYCEGKVYLGWCEKSNSYKHYCISHEGWVLDVHSNLI